MMHRRKILALAIIALPAVAHGQPMPPPGGPPQSGPPPPGGPPTTSPPPPGGPLRGIRQFPLRGVHHRRHPDPRRDHRGPLEPIAGAGEEVAGAGMAIVGSGFPVDGGGNSSSGSPRHLSHRRHHGRARARQQRDQPPTLLTALTRSPRKELVMVTSGQIARRSDPCEGMSPHGYFGIESAVVQRISDWIRAAGVR